MSYASEVLADSPLLYLRFEETTGTTCANDGSLGGSATAGGTYVRNYATGLAGLGVGINLGAAGYVNYPDNASLDITGDVTYECWANSDGTQNRCLMSKGAGGGLAGYQLEVRLGEAIRVLKSTVAVLVSAPAASYPLTTWTHIAFTRSGNTYTIYVNGASVATASSITTTINATSETLGIGTAPAAGSNSDVFIGKIDEAAVYGTALSAARLLAHYNARNTGGAVTPAFVPQIAII